MVEAKSLVAAMGTSLSREGTLNLIHLFRCIVRPLSAQGKLAIRLYRQRLGFKQRRRLRKPGVSMAASNNDFQNISTIL